MIKIKNLRVNGDRKNSSNKKRGNKGKILVLANTKDS